MGSKYRVEQPGQADEPEAEFPGEPAPFVGDDASLEVTSVDVDPANIPFGRSMLTPAGWVVSTADDPRARR